MTVFSVAALLITLTWFSLLVYSIYANAKIKLLEGHLLATQVQNTWLVDKLRKLGNAALFAGTSLSSLESLVTIDAYPDKDGDGVPDAFQRRKPLSEILEFEKPSEHHANDYWVAIELPPRPPLKDEYYISPTGIHRSPVDFANYSAVIVKAVPGTDLDDLVDLTK